MCRFLCILALLLLCDLARADQCVNAMCNVDDSSLRFFLVGDWGGKEIRPFTTPEQREVAANVGKLASQFNTHFQFLLGDNFYLSGVKNVDDKRFKETFEDVYIGPVLESTPFHVIVGNHDHRGNVQAQIDYSQKSSRWNFPSQFYTLSYNLTKSGTVVSFVLIDTIVLCGNVADDDDLSQPAGPENRKLADDYWVWLQMQLQSLSLISHYLFVLGHYPVYSVAEHGPTNTLVQRLQPLLEKYNANAYFCGHDHNLQHISVNTSSSKIDYIVAGASAKTSTSQSHKDKVPANSLRYFYPTSLTFKHGGFVYVEASSTESTFHYYTSDGGTGSETYKFSSEPRKLP